MNKEDQHIKPLMQIIFGIGLFVFYKMTLSTLEIVTNWENTTWYDPSDKLFFLFLKWATLLSSIALIIIGGGQLIKRLIKNG